MSGVASFSAYRRSRGQPVDRRRVALALHDRAPGRADRGERIVVELAAADDRQPVVQQADQQPSHPGLGLPPFAEEHEVLAGQDRVLDGRDDRLLVADDARQDLATRREAAEQVGPQLLLDGPSTASRTCGARPGSRRGTRWPSETSVRRVGGRTRSTAWRDVGSERESMVQQGRPHGGRDRVTPARDESFEQCHGEPPPRCSKSPAGIPIRIASSGVTPQPNCSKASDRGSQVARTAGPSRWRCPWTSRTTGRT